VLPAAALPDLSSPNIVALGAALGGYFGETRARWLGYDADKRLRTVLVGSYYGTGVTICLFVFFNLFSGLF